MLSTKITKTLKPIITHIGIPNKVGFLPTDFNLATASMCNKCDLYVRPHRRGTSVQCSEGGSKCGVVPTSGMSWYPWYPVVSGSSGFRWLFRLPSLGWICWLDWDWFFSKHATNTWDTWESPYICPGRKGPSKEGEDKPVGFQLYCLRMKHNKHNHKLSALNPTAREKGASML